MSPTPAPLNHVAVSMPRAALDDAGRADILAFYGEVFGWSELADQDEPGDPLILATGAFGQFVYLLPSDDPMRTDPMDHFGVLAATLDDLDRILGRATAYARRDERVRVITRHARTTHGPTADYTLTSGYVGFVLPLMVEVQHLERRARSRSRDHPPLLTTGIDLRVAVATNRADRFERPRHRTCADASTSPWEPAPRAPVVPLSR